MKPQYKKQWKIPSNSDPSKTYTVSLTMNDQYICHCWPFLKTRKECNHIILAKSGEFDSIDPPNGESRGTALLKGYAEKGYRWITWYPERMYSWDRRDLERVKRNPGYADVKTFVSQGRRIVVAKEKPEVYQLEITNFICEMKSYDFRKVEGRLALRETLRKKFFDLTQHVLYNSTGTVMNPNLPDGSVYVKGHYGKQLHRLSTHYKWLR